MQVFDGFALAKLQLFKLQNQKLAGLTDNSPFKLYKIW